MAAGYAQFSVSHGEPFTFLLRAKDADREPISITTPARLVLANGQEFPLVQGEAPNELRLNISEETIRTIPADSYRAVVWVTLSEEPFQLIVGRFNVRKET